MRATGEKPASSSSSDSLGITHYLLLIGLCALIFLPGISSLPPIDRDEARFVQATRQMSETGDYLDIRFQESSRYKKPVGIYWLQSAAVFVSGQGSEAPIWVYRTVSQIGATIAVLATAWIGAWLFGPAAGFAAGIGLAGILLLGVEARIAKTDATLLATTVVTQAALARIYVGFRLNRPSPVPITWLFWLSQSVGILLKGPVVPLLSVLTIGGIAIFDRNLNWLGRLKPLAGIGLVMLIAAPWLIYVTYKSGGAFWLESLAKDALGKVTSGQESHGAPPGAYLLSIPLFIWPFSLLITVGLLRAWNGLRQDPRLLFCCAWVLPLYFLMELVPTKLPHYILPTYPALTILMGWAISSTTHDETNMPIWQVWFIRVARFGSLFATLGLAALLIGVTVYLQDEISVWGMAAGTIAIATGLLGIGLFPQIQPSKRIPMMALGSGLVLTITAAKILPNLDDIWLSPQIAEAFSSNKPCRNSRLVSAGYAEPSLIFLTKTDTLLTNPIVAAEHLSRLNSCDMALIENHQTEAFFSALSGGEATVDGVAQFDGINYSNGKALTLTLYRRTW